MSREQVLAQRERMVVAQTLTDLKGSLRRIAFQVVTLDSNADKIRKILYEALGKVETISHK